MGSALRKRLKRDPDDQREKERMLTWYKHRIKILKGLNNHAHRTIMRMMCVAGIPVTGGMAALGFI